MYHMESCFVAHDKPEQPHAATQAAPATQVKDEPTTSGIVAAEPATPPAAPAAVPAPAPRHQLPHPLLHPQRLSFQRHRHRRHTTSTVVHSQEMTRKFLSHVMAPLLLHAFFATKFIGLLIVNTSPLFRRVEGDLAISSAVKGA